MRSLTASMLGLDAPTTAAGVPVTVESAMASATVFACIRVLSENVAMLPLHIYRRTDDGRGKERAREHPLYTLLHDAPNPEMTAFEWRELVIQHCASWGNHYSEIERTNGGRVVALWPLRSDRMWVRRLNRQLVYQYSEQDGTISTLRPDQVLHVRFMGSGNLGISPIRLQMNSIGLDLATEEFGARYFSNGAKPGIVIKHPRTIGPDAQANIIRSWNENSQGLARAHRPQVLEEGMDVVSMGIPPEEAQFLQTRKFQRSVIAGWYRVPAHLIGDLENATFSNIEQQALGFEKFTLVPWLRRVDQRLALSLLTPAERRDHFIETQVNALMWADIETRAGFYSTLANIGAISANEVRALENMNPYDGGDVYLRPLNMTTTRQRAAPQAQIETRQEEQSQGEIERIAGSRHKVAMAAVPLYDDAAQRVINREIADLRRALNNMTLAQLGDWLPGFFTDLRDAMPRYFRAILVSMADSVLADVAIELAQADPDVVFDNFIEAFLENVAIGWVVEHENRVKDLIARDDADAISDQLDDWKENEAGRRAQDLAIEATNALAIVGYGALGVQSLRWVAVGDSCTFCNKLDGTTIRISGFFMQAGDEIDGGDAGKLTTGRNRRHGPIHKGCDCIQIAVQE